jgi:hypothetical protein
MEAAKPYTIKIELREEYLYVVVSGEKLTPAISIAYWNEIAEKCFESDCRKILFERNFPETVTAEEMLQMAEHLGNLLPNRLVAFVDHYGHENVNELGKRLARNRHVMAQICEDTSSAERWLLAN